MARTKHIVPKSMKGGKVLKENIAGRNLMGSQKKSSQTIKQRKFEPGKIALKEIRKYQHSTELLLRKAPFQRIIKSILLKMEDGDKIRFQRASFHQIQTALEYFLVGVLEDSLRLSIHAKRKTLFGADIRLIYKIKHAKDFEIDMFE